MSAFQILGTALAAAFVLLILAGLLRRRLRLAVALPWLFVWLAAGLAMARPELTAVVARAMGITRGADLVFYCGMLAMMGGFFAVFLKLRRIEAEVTRLVRHLALEDAEAPPQANAAEDERPRP